VNHVKPTVGGLVSLKS